MSDPPPYGFHPDYSPPLTTNIPPEYHSGINLSYPMPMPWPVTQNPTSMTGEVIEDSNSVDSSDTNELKDSCEDSFQLYYRQYPIPGYCWQHFDSSEPFPIHKAVRAGKDEDGSDIYVGRAFHEGDMIPAKIIPSKNSAFISYGGEEIATDDYEFLRKGDFVWEFAKNGEIPNGAVEVGCTVDGEKLYMGRCLYQGTQTPGKIQASHGCLYIPFNGEEISINEYEVLLIK